MAPLAVVPGNFQGGGLMKIERRKFVFRNLIGIALLTGFIFLIANPALAAIGSLERQKETNFAQEYHEEDLYRILAVLEGKMGRKKLSPKAREKLFTLSGDQTRLVTSLCDRISDDGRSAGANIAYLLAIALILLS